MSTPTPPPAKPAGLPPGAPLALAGAAAALAGSFLPWAVVRTGLGSIDLNGHEGDGQLTAVAAGVALLVGWAGMSTRSTRPITVALVAALVGLCIAGYGWTNLSDAARAATSEYVKADVGYGLYMCLGGFLACAIGLLDSFAKSGREPVQETGPRN